MGRVKNFMLLEGGDSILWERHGCEYEGTVECLSGENSSRGDAYIVLVNEKGTSKEYTVYPSEVCFDKMLRIRNTTKRWDSLMRSEDLND